MLDNRRVENSQLHAGLQSGLANNKRAKRPQHNLLSYLLVEFTMTPWRLLNA